MRPIPSRPNLNPTYAIEGSHILGQWRNYATTNASDLVRAEQRHAQLVDDGDFALWSHDPPDESYLQTLRQHFTSAWGEVVEFPNPLQGRSATNTVYLGIP